MSKFSLMFLLALLCTVISTSVYAQSKRQVKDSTVTIVFSESARTTSTTHKKSDEDNIIKIAPLGFISGTFPLLYERRITDFFSVEAGAGLTNKNYIRSAIRGSGEDGVTIKDYPWGATYYDDIAEASFQYENRKPKMGFMYRLEPRIYFESEAPDGSYLGFQYQMAKYKFDIPALQGSNGNYTYSGAPQHEYENVTDFMIHFGNQWVNDRITVESSTGIGLRKIQGVKYVAADTGSGGIKDGLAPYSQSTINLGVGFTVGYHF
jgi:hypothetical protein